MRSFMIAFNIAGIFSYLNFSFNAVIPAEPGVSHEKQTGA